MSEKQKREAIDVLIKRGELSMKDISKSSGVSLATVYKVKSRGSNIVGLLRKIRSGRPPTMRLSILRSLAQLVRSGSYLFRRSLVHLIRGWPSHETIRRTLKTVKYTKKHPSNPPLVSEKKQNLSSKIGQKAHVS
ncbi:hypothetical protein LOD99_11010 [Oopsacas minuta]|uniref:Resolvase HTH domain-containing protein n=1 Tax=Oopsacas minuta TaxID=111878 RepID=A0AAV7KCR4_9METZ|nr:hypothetical protein LOD99_11010 [Oopsacas minuta]